MTLPEDVCWHFSLLFIGFSINETTWLIQNDFTGQGLIGMVLLAPIFITCVVGLFVLFPARSRKEFVETAPQSPEPSR